MDVITGLIKKTWKNFLDIFKLTRQKCTCEV